MTARPTSDVAGVSERTPLADTWLLDQLEAWPTRVHPGRTTNIQYLMQEAAKVIRSQDAALTLFAGHMEADTFAFGDTPSDCYEAARSALARSSVQSEDGR